MLGRSGREHNENTSAECSERDDVKIVEIDTIQSSTSSTNNYYYSSHQQLHRFPQNLSVSSIPSLCRTKPLQIHSTGCFGEDEERNNLSAQTPARYTYYCSRLDQRGRNNVPEPKYMAATASAVARRSLSAPRQRSPSTPERVGKNGIGLVEKKRLSFADPPCNETAAGAYNLSSLQSMLRNTSSCKMGAGKGVPDDSKISSPSSSSSRGGERKKWLR